MGSRYGGDRKLTSNEEALLIATACSRPPEGRARWTLELLAGAMVKLRLPDRRRRIDLLRHLTGATFVEALEQLGERTDLKAKADIPADLREGKPAPQSSDHAASVQRIIAQLVPIKGTDGERYLRETRGIDTSSIADVLELTHAVGWHPAVYFNQPDHELHGRSLGCIVGVMTDPATALPTGAISRTYVHEGRKIGKAKTLGSPAGIIRLSEDADVLEGLHLAEGIETALAAMSLGLRPTWATGSKSIMAKFPVLSGIEALTIIADNDANGAGERAAREVAGRWLQAGREVRTIVWNKTGDINDAIREGET